MFLMLLSFSAFFKENTEYFMKPVIHGHVKQQYTSSFGEKVDKNLETLAMFQKCTYRWKNSINYFKQNELDFPIVANNLPKASL